MNLSLYILFMFLLLRECYGVIYYLNASEYERMPPIYNLDSYDTCLQDPSDIYCTLNFQLVSDEPNEFLHIIEEYSKHSKTHFNHTKLRYGTCVTKNCQNYIQNKTSVSETILEECLNQSFWEYYQLKTRIQDYSCYSLSDNDVKFDISDMVTGIVVFAIIALNVVGSFYDVWCTSNNHEGKHILLSFSIKRNWKTLTSTMRSNDSRLESLKGLNGIRCLATYITTLVHCFFPFFTLGENIHQMELSYHKLYIQLLVNASVMLQTYFVLSAFLMTYKMEMNSEKRPINWRTVPKEIFLRYIRLTPAYALVILLMATWFKFIGPGPLWKIRGEVELLDCKKLWWMNLLYVNNYVYNFPCLLPFWYLTTDMQLFCCGLILYMLLRNSRYKKTILISLIVVGSVISAVHTYVRDLDFGTFFVPSAVSEWFEEDPAFNEVYKMAHGNISSYVIGMSLGYFVYKWQHKKIDDRKYWLFRCINYIAMLLVIGLALSGAIFYRNGSREPLYIRVLFSAFAKPIAGILTATVIVGMIFNFGSVHRYFYEWHIWTIPSKLTYGVYLLHFPYLIIYTIMHRSLVQMTGYNLIMLSVYITISSFVTAIPMFLLIEAPFSELSKYFTKPPKKETVADNRYHKKSK